MNSMLSRAKSLVDNSKQRILNFNFPGTNSKIEADPPFGAAGMKKEGKFLFFQN